MNPLLFSPLMQRSNICPCKICEKGEQPYVRDPYLLVAMPGDLLYEWCKHFNLENPFNCAHTRLITENEGTTEEARGRIADELRQNGINYLPMVFARYDDPNSGQRVIIPTARQFIEYRNRNTIPVERFRS